MAKQMSRASLVQKTRDWLNRTGDFDYKSALTEYEKFGSMVDVARSKYQADSQLQLRDIPLMLQDPIIAACLASMMETAFQPTHDQTLFQVQSRYPKLADDLNGWGREVGMDDSGLLFGNNLGIYGNLPIKMHYNSRMQLERFSPIPNFLSVVPVVISNRVIGHFVDGQFMDYYEYVYGQYLHYRDLGGSRSPMFNLTRTPGDKDESKILQNEFVVAPSYLSPAVRPWRNLRLIEDVLLLQRMDQSNFLRIVGVNVGDTITSKNAMKILGFYRGIFKKARRVAFDAGGMASSSFGNEFEVVVPTTTKQGLEIKDVGGSIDVKALKDVDVQYQRLFTALRTSPSIVGFTEETPSSLGEGPTTIWNQNHARTAKTFQYSVIKIIKQIYLLRARSIGYDVNENDFTVSVTAASTIEEESKRKAISAGLEVVRNAFEIIAGTGIEFNKDYLAKKLIGEAFASSPIDVSELFNVEKRQNNLTSVNSSLILRDALPRVSIMESSGLITSSVAQAYRDQVEVFQSQTEGQLKAETKGPITSSLQIPQSTMERRELSYSEFMTMGYLGSGYTVDVSTVDNAEILPSDFRFDSLRQSKVMKSATLPVKAVALQSTQTKMSADDLMNGQIATIKRAGVVNSRYVFDNEEDLTNYLYLASSGIKHFLVEEVYFSQESHE